MPVHPAISQPRRWSIGVATRSGEQGKIPEIDASIKKRRDAPWLRFASRSLRLKASRLVRRGWLGRREGSAGRMWGGGRSVDGDIRLGGGVDQGPVEGHGAPQGQGAFPVVFED